ncbi:secreted protein, partial [gut metagenome]
HPFLSNPKRKVHYSLLATLNICLLLSILGAIMLNTRALHQKIEENTLIYAKEVSSQLADNISTRGHLRLTYIRNLADTLSHIPPESVTEELLNCKAPYLEMKELFVVNSDGSTLPADKAHWAVGAYLAKKRTFFLNRRFFWRSTMRCTTQHLLCSILVKKA